MNHSCTLLLTDVVIQHDGKGSILFTLEGGRKKRENKEDAVHKVVNFNICATSGSEQETEVGVDYTCQLLAAI